MTTHTFPNGCVVQIDLESIPDEARWLTMDDDRRSWVWRDKPLWLGAAGIKEAWHWGPSPALDWHAPPAIVSGTLPAWSECIIDLEAVRAKALTDDGPPRLYDVVQLNDGGPVWLLEQDQESIRSRWTALNLYLASLETTDVVIDERCTIIARNVYDIREAMRLMREAE